MSTCEYYVVDVFTGKRFQGNPLAVVFTASDLSQESYEKIAREFNYSETSFIYYSAPGQALQVRSFTSAGFEVNGAGHHLLGAVYAARLKGIDIFKGQENVFFVLIKDKKIQVSLTHFEGDLSVIGMRQRKAKSGNKVEREAIAEALSVEASQILDNGVCPIVVETEVAHLMVPVKDIEALNKAIPRKSLLMELAAKAQFEGIYCYCLSDDIEGYIAHTRFFNPGMGIAEDPATGSAAGPLAGYLFETGYLMKNKVYRFLQGQKMNHPSILQVQLTEEGIWIGGNSAVVMKGIIYI